jgi:hypothetical protein
VLSSNRGLAFRLCVVVKQGFGVPRTRNGGPAGADARGAFRAAGYGACPLLVSCLSRLARLRALGRDHGMRRGNETSTQRDRPPAGRPVRQRRSERGMTTAVHVHVSRRECGPIRAGARAPCTCTSSFLARRSAGKVGL